MTLTEFLLARIDEDEAAARAAGAWLRAPDGHNDDVLWSVTDGRQAEPLLAQYAVGRHFDHIARHDPARVLAECEAKRSIIAMHHVRESSPSCAECGGYTATTDSTRGIVHHGYAVPWPCPALRILALPYANHPDYRDEWKP